MISTEIWLPILVGLGVQTLVLVISVVRLHGSIMRKLGEFETKVETLWDQFLQQAQR